MWTNWMNEFEDYLLLFMNITSIQEKIILQLKIDIV